MDFKSDLSYQTKALNTIIQNMKLSIQYYVAELNSVGAKQEAGTSLLAMIVPSTVRSSAPTRIHNGLLYFKSRDCLGGRGKCSKKCKKNAPKNIRSMHSQQSPPQL